MIKLTSTLFLICGLLIGNSAYAQTAEEVIDLYFETIGGKDKVATLKSTKAICKAKAQGMELPVVMVSAAPNMQRMDMNFQGKDITQMAFDGETAWGVNFMTMEAEAMDSEQSLVMGAQSDYPDPFLNYMDKGYTIELTGEEDVEGVDCHIIKLTRKPVMIAEKEEENITLYFMDKENGIVIKQVDYALTGPAKGATIETFFSDYEEVEGIYFPFTMVQMMNDTEVFSVAIQEMIINPELPEGYFKMPE